MPTTDLRDKDFVTFRVNLLDSWTIDLTFMLLNKIELIMVISIRMIPMVYRLIIPEIHLENEFLTLAHGIPSFSHHKFLVAKNF